jgi:hypothetical protein
MLKLCNRRADGGIISSFCWICNYLLLRCTFVFKSFWGGTWGCEKIMGGPLFSCFLHFYDPIFQSLLSRYMKWPSTPSPPRVHLWFTLMYLWFLWACKWTLFILKTSWANGIPAWIKTLVPLVLIYIQRC